MLLFYLKMSTQIHYLASYSVKVWKMYDGIWKPDPKPREETREIEAETPAEAEEKAKELMKRFDSDNYPGANVTLVSLLEISTTIAEKPLELDGELQYEVSKDFKVGDLVSSYHTEKDNFPSMSGVGKIVEINEGAERPFICEFDGDNFHYKELEIDHHESY